MSRLKFVVYLKLHRQSFYYGYYIVSDRTLEDLSG